MILSLVVPGIVLTIAFFFPINLLNRVDLPTFGLPISAIVKFFKINPIMKIICVIRQSVNAVCFLLVRKLKKYQNL